MASDVFRSYSVQFPYLNLIKELMLTETPLSRPESSNFHLSDLLSSSLRFGNNNHLLVQFSGNQNEPFII